MDERPGRVSCPHCGKSYRWKPAFAGRKARCKRCGGVIRMPIEAPAGGDGTAIGGAIGDAPGGNEFELLEPGQTAATAPLPPGTLPGTPGTARCPSCGNAVKSGAVICINCGFHIREGKQLQTAVDLGEDDASENKKKTRKQKKAQRTAQPSGEQPLGQGKAIKERLADREDKVHASKVIDIYVPLAMIAIGIVITLVDFLFLINWSITTGGGPSAAVAAISIGAALILMAVFTVMNVIFMLVALFVSAKILGVGFGPLHIGLLKLTGLALGPGGIGMLVEDLLKPVLIGSNFVGSAVGGLIALILLAKLFDLDGSDAFWVLVIMWVLKVGALMAFFVLALMLIPML
jgi:uncharacterized Zn finger protein (UPF0148 family)